jgi:excisionase family DNA binding protein
MAIMRGFGQFQRAQMKGVDPRIGQIFHHMREVIETLEQMMLHPYSPPTRDQPLQPNPEKSPPAPTLDQTKLAYTIKEICKLIGISRATFYQAMQNKELRAVKRGRRTLIMAKDLEAWMQAWPER